MVNGYVRCNVISFAMKQSTPDPLMAFRVLQYTLQAIDQHLQAGEVIKRLVGNERLHPNVLASVMLHPTESPRH